MKSFEMVMNNNDLRNIIFSYFRKKPEKICVTCQKVCVWNKVKIRNLNSGLHSILFAQDGTLIGAADPRREGLVMGE